MEGGMGMRGNLLDPGAQEFYPVIQYVIAPPQIYYPYTTLPPAPPTPLHVYQPQEAQYVSAVARGAGDGSPTRAVVLSMVPRHVGVEAVRVEMEPFGRVRAVDMRALLSEGVVTVHFYDLRSAQAAVAEVREQHLRQQSRLSQQYGLLPGSWAPWEWTAEAVQPQHRMDGVLGLIAGVAVWAQFGATGLDVRNQGSLAVFNSDGISSAELREVFQAFGAVKEVRESQPKHDHKFVEFYDIRDAARALSEINGKEILGRRLVVEFSRPGGQASSSYHKRSSNCESCPVPPRLLRDTHGTSRWSRDGEDRPQCSSSQSGGAIGGSGGNRGGEGLSLHKRSDTSPTRSSNGNNNSSSSGRRNKGSRGGGSSSGYPSPSSSTLLKQQSGRKGWKHHSKNSGEARFLFKEVEMGESSHTSFRDSRTTVMIKNIPNKYSQQLLLDMLDNHCMHCNEKIGEGRDEPLSAYDFVYLPIDFSNKCNVGYGFVNLTTPEATWRLYKAFHMQRWEAFNSRKICQVTYARLQGLEKLKEHFRSSKFACDNDEYMPVVFSPPRDGKQLSDPVPIGWRASAVGAYRRIVDLARVRRDQELAIVEAPPPNDGGGASSTTTSTQAPSDHADGGDDDDMEC